MSNLPTVQAIYQAFGQGDIPTILGHLAQESRGSSGPTTVPRARESRI